MSMSQPEMTAEEAFQLFMTPGVTAPRARREQELANRGERLEMVVFGQLVRGHRWGSSDGKKVLVQHGWGSRGTAMWAIIKRLEAAGFQVFAFDAPGHGDSENNVSSMFQFAETQRVAGAIFGEFESIVSHSIAASGMPLALSQGLSANRVVLISARNDIAKFLVRFMQLAGIPDELFDGIRDIWDQILGWDNVMAATPSRLAPSMKPHALIIHDRDDEDVDFEDASVIHSAWLGSILILTDGLGHARIVRSDEVADQICEFLTSD
jgi:pimeloyl-ACP methyl ester carboxylesterase